MVIYHALRIEVCPKEGITPKILLFSDGIGTRKIQSSIGMGLDS